MIIQREAVRAVLLTPEREVLLLRVRPPDGGDCFWITPGGGLQFEETVEDALRRELREEVGLQELVMGPRVWRRQHTFDWAGKRICQREEYYIVPVSRFEPRMSDVEEAKVLDQFRWWALADLDELGERVTPLALAQIVGSYRSHGPPREPLETEVLVD